MARGGGRADLHPPPGLLLFYTDCKQKSDRCRASNYGQEERGARIKFLRVTEILKLVCVCVCVLLIPRDEEEIAGKGEVGRRCNGENVWRKIRDIKGKGVNPCVFFLMIRLD